MAASIRIVLVLALVQLGWSPQVRAQISLSMDFDSGSLDVAQSVINGTQVTLEPRRFQGKDDKEWGSYGTDFDWWWIYFKASGVKDQALAFRLSKQGVVPLSHMSTHSYVYSYDNENWSFFDNTSISGEIFEFGNDAPFDQDVVYIAFSLPYTVEMTRAHTEKIQSSPHLSPTKSADDNLVIGQSAGGTDDLGRTIPAHDLYAYTITDATTTGPKAKVVLMTGNHSGETIGNYLYQGMVDFLLGDEPEAVELRDLVEFYCYPQVDPDGRWAGYFRSNPENPTLNHNRYWDKPDGFTDLTVITRAMKADTGGAIDFFFDVHSQPSSTLSFFYEYETHQNPTFTNKLNELNPSITSQSFPPCPGCADGWALLSDGLNARYGFTPEPGTLAGKPPDFYFEMGQNYMLALLAALKDTGATEDAGIQDAGPQADAGVDAAVIGPGDDADEEGCSCALGSTGPDLPLLPLALLLVVLGWLARRHSRD